MNLLPPYRFGTCSWLFDGLPLTDLAAKAANLKMDGLELKLDPTKHDAKQVSQILADHELELFALSPLDVDLCHLDIDEWQNAFKNYLEFMDFAAEIGEPLILMDSRSRGSDSNGGYKQLVMAVHGLAHEAQRRNLKIAFEIRNRYENRFVNTCAQGMSFLAKVAEDNVGIALSAFDMNIEEQHAAGAIETAGDRLFLYKIADSNRQGIGRGHIKLGPHLWALEEINYQAPIMFESPGENLELAETYLRESRSWF